MIAIQIRRLGNALLVGFAAVVLGLGWWQVAAAGALATRPDNPQVIAAHRSQPRGTIFDATGTVLARTTVADGVASRAYADPAFAHVLGYASLRYGVTGIEAAWDDLLTGLRDPNPINQWLDDILNRPVVPYDLTLTLDRRLQDYAAAQLGGAVGAIVAIDPSTGAILAMTSTPTFDATSFSGDSAADGAAWDAITSQPNDPLVDRARNGEYVPGSIMKVATAAIGLDSGRGDRRDHLPDTAPGGGRRHVRRRIPDHRARSGRTAAGVCGTCPRRCRSRATSTSRTSAWRSARTRTCAARPTSGSAPACASVPWPIR